MLSTEYVQKVLIINTLHTEDKITVLQKPDAATMEKCAVYNLLY